MTFTTYWESDQIIPILRIQYTIYIFIITILR